MRDILDQVIAWHRQGTACALATVVRTRGSAPRPVGTAMAVAESGEVAGSLSGGCVEGAVYELAREMLATGRAVVESFGIADQDAFAAGLTCGGEIDVHVRPLGGADCAVLQELAALCAAGQPAALVVPLGEQAGREGWRLAGPDRPLAGSLGDGAREALIDGMPRILAGDGGHAARKDAGAAHLVLPFAPRPRMIVAGATDFAGALTRIGAFLGYRVTLCDARPVFATRERFPHAGEVVVDWPHRYLEKLASAPSGIDPRTVICVLTHDPKFDVPALLQALRSRAGYVGAMGSRRAHLDRLRRLREAGLAEREVSRLHSPIGLDLGARSPEETAVSIAAEIVAARWGRSGTPSAAPRPRSIEGGPGRRGSQPLQQLPELRHFLGTQGGKRLGERDAHRALAACHQFTPACAEAVPVDPPVAVRPLHEPIVHQPAQHGAHRLIRLRGVHRHLVRRGVRVLGDGHQHHVLRHGRAAWRQCCVDRLMLALMNLAQEHPRPPGVTRSHIALPHVGSLTSSARTRMLGLPK